MSRVGVVVVAHLLSWALLTCTVEGQGSTFVFIGLAYVAKVESARIKNKIGASGHDNVKNHTASATASGLVCCCKNEPGECPYNYQHPSREHAKYFWHKDLLGKFAIKKGYMGGRCCKTEGSWCQTFGSEYESIPPNDGESLSPWCQNCDDHECQPGWVKKEKVGSKQPKYIQDKMKRQNEHTKARIAFLTDKFKRVSKDIPDGVRGVESIELMRIKTQIFDEEAKLKRGYNKPWDPETQVSLPFPSEDRCCEKTPDWAK